MEDVNFSIIQAIDQEESQPFPVAVNKKSPIMKQELSDEKWDGFYLVEFDGESHILQTEPTVYTSDNISLATEDNFSSAMNLTAITLDDGTQAFLTDSGELFKMGDSQIAYVQDQTLTEQEIEKDDEFVEVQALQNDESVTSEDAEEELHLKKHACTFNGCERRYTTKHHLRVHERVHTGERPYACTTCGNTFATSYSLKTHHRTHTGARPFQCTTTGCTKSFKTSGDLQKHARTHTGERPFTCPVTGCGRSFTTSNIMKVHMRTHTGERPYGCKYCDKRFSSTTNYRNHERIHTGDKPYICSVESCGKRFTEYSSLYKHQVVHVTSRNYQCEICDRNFKQAQSLESHYLMAHSSMLGNESQSNSQQMIDFLTVLPTTEENRLEREFIDNSLQNSEIINEIKPENI